MFDYPVHTLADAPDASRPSLEALHDAFGVIPNIAGAMAGSPVLIGSLVGVFGKVHGGSFSEDQIQVVLLTDAVVNRSAWPVAFHSTLAEQAGIDRAEIERIRDGELPSDPRHAALSALARTMIEKRGHLSTHDKQGFVDAGFTAEHLLEVVAIVAASTMTNYAATITQPPLEDAFMANAWSAGAQDKRLRVAFANRRTESDNRPHSLSRLRNEPSAYIGHRQSARRLRGQRACE